MASGEGDPCADVLDPQWTVIFFGDPDSRSRSKGLDSKHTRTVRDKRRVVAL